jgi:raffinose/stachyose/melibiose transport system permease protein
VRYVYTPRKFALLLLPQFTLFTVFVVIPVFVVLYFSFTNFKAFGAYDFIGFRNYAQLFKDRFFLIGLKNTVIVTIVSMVIGIPLAFLFALFVNKPGIKNTVYKTIFFGPNTLSGIVVGLMWAFVLDPFTGFINVFLRSIGLGNLALEWIGGRVLTPYTVGVISSWTGLGFAMVIWIAGLKAIPEEVIESSIIDGANKIQQIVYIILPMLKESFKTIFVLSVVGGLKVFETVYILTGGGPGHYSETMVSYLYSTTFMSRRYGYGSAMGMIEFLITLAVTGIFLYLTRKRVET